MDVIDNISTLLGDDLKATLKKDDRVRCIAPAFSIYAFDALRRSLERLGRFDFIFLGPSFVADGAGLVSPHRQFVIPPAMRPRDLTGTPFEIGLRNRMTARATAQDCARWIRRSARFKANVAGGAMPTFLSVDGAAGLTTHTNLSGLTAPDLGYEPGDGLREGWDNPNVFQICTLKHSDNEVGKRQEVGRGLRIAVDRHGNWTDGTNVHDINVLTVVASESYEDFAKALQDEMRDALKGRPLEANEAFFKGKVIPTSNGNVMIDEATARKLQFWLIQNAYVDHSYQILPAYHTAKSTGSLVALPVDLAPMQDGLLALVDTVYDPSQALKIVNGHKTDVTPVAHPPATGIVG